MSYPLSPDQAETLVQTQPRQMQKALHVFVTKASADKGVATLDELADMRDRLTAVGALVGASDHHVGAEQRLPLAECRAVEVLGSESVSLNDLDFVLAPQQAGFRIEHLQIAGTPVVAIESLASDELVEQVSRAMSQRRQTSRTMVDLSAFVLPAANFLS